MASKSYGDPQSPIALGQECTESLVWTGMGSNYVPDHFTDHRENQTQPPQTQKRPKVARVKLNKSPSRPKPPKFFVLPAGGMNVPVPELDTRPTPRGTKGGYSEGQGHGGGTGQLPLGVELIAGRGHASEVSKGGSTWSKVKSLPPSHTLAMSASLLKSYFTSSSSSSSAASSSATSSSSSPATDKQQQQAKNAVITPDTETSVKTKMIGLWNNVKYGWTVNLKTNFSRDSPVYLLGSVYHKSLGDDGEDNDQVEVDRHGMEAFKRHFHTLVWCTYRRQFPTLQDSSLTTDCGWGCMLRSGQMMVAQALIRRFLGPDWRHDKKGNDLESPEELIHRNIIRWFGDSPSPHCPLSLHNLVHLGHKLGKKAGDWYGPASVAYIFKEAIEMGSRYIPDLKHVCVYVAQDCAVYIQDVLDLCSSPCLCKVGTFNSREGQGRDRTRGTTAYRDSPSHYNINTHTIDGRIETISGRISAETNGNGHGSEMETARGYVRVGGNLEETETRLPQSCPKVEGEDTRKTETVPRIYPILDEVNLGKNEMLIPKDYPKLDGNLDKTKTGTGGLYPKLGNMTTTNATTETGRNYPGHEQNSDKTETGISRTYPNVEGNGNERTYPNMQRKSDKDGTETGVPQGYPEVVNGDLCPRCDNWRAVVIMVPVRLGGESLNPIYAPCIYSLFTHDLCIGIIGGRPKHSLYFVGFQEESLIHLDPHLCQDAVAVTLPVFSPSSYHCSSPRKMALSRMDPSATLGFYCHSRTQFLRLMEELPELVTPKEPGFEYPIFEFIDGSSPDADACTRQVSTEDQLAASLPSDTPLLPQDSEEFVFL